jgi:hypothetical protein
MPTGKYSPRIYSFLQQRATQELFVSRVNVFGFFLNRKLSRKAKFPSLRLLCVERGRRTNIVVTKAEASM